MDVLNGIMAYVSVCIELRLIVMRSNSVLDVISAAITKIAQTKESKFYASGKIRMSSLRFVIATNEIFRKG